MYSVPKNHKVWIRWNYQDNIFLITTKGDDRSKHYLFRVNGNKCEQIATNPNPTKLEEIMKKGKYNGETVKEDKIGGVPQTNSLW